MTRYAFGPVPSRRLGRSLGVDLVPFKTCTYDCVYCQLGPTTCKTAERKQWVPLDEVLRDVERKLETQPDYITLSGSGEPTLFAPLDKLIQGIRELTDTPIVVLTNGSLLWLPEVRDELSEADLVIPSLDAGREVTFQTVNRPHPDISFERMLNGLIALRHQGRAKQQYWLEVFVLGGHTDSDHEMAGIRRCVDLIQPDRVQLNTVTRPPAEKSAVAVARIRLEELAAEFTPPAEVIAEFHTERALKAGQAGREEILQLLRRRPCSIEDMVDGLGIHRNEILKAVEHLQAKGVLAISRVGDKSYYQMAPEHPG